MELRPEWNSRFHVQDAQVSRSPSASPPIHSLFKARNGHPVRAVVDVRPPRSFETTRPHRSQLRSRHFLRRPGSEAAAGALPKILSPSAEPGGSSSRRRNGELDKRKKSLAARRVRAKSISGLAERQKGRRPKTTDVAMLQQSIDRAVEAVVAKRGAGRKSKRRRDPGGGVASPARMPSLLVEHSSWVTDGPIITGILDAFEAAAEEPSAMPSGSTTTESAQGLDTGDLVPEIERLTFPPDDRDDLRPDLRLEQELAGGEGPTRENRPLRRAARAGGTLDDTLLGSSSRRQLFSNDSANDAEANLTLDLDRIQAEAPEEDSHSDRFGLTDSGAFNIDGFEIRSSGLVTKDPGGTGDRPVSGESTGLEPGVSPTFGGIQDSLVTLGLLGRGTSGTVHKALHVPTLRLVAVKEIPVFEATQRQQMVRELHTLYENLAPLDDSKGDTTPTRPSSKACPHIVTFYDAFMTTSDCVVAIVVEYMDGGSLQDIVKAGGCQDEQILASIGFQMLRGLAFLHSRRKMHRDIKPSNVLINHLGDVKYCDFGLARELDNAVAEAETFVGTYPYMSPERIIGQPYTTSSDIWAFGLTMMALALGRFPYAGGATDVRDYWSMLHALTQAPVPKLGDDFSAAFSDFVSQCLNKAPEQRPSAEELLQHPFLKNHKVGRSPSRSPGVSPGRVIETGASAKDELHDIVNVVKKYYTRLWMAQAEEGQAPCIPNFNHARLSRLACHLELDYETVREAFRRLVHDLRRSLDSLLGA